jgi:phage terminase small subunit
MTNTRIRLPTSQTDAESPVPLPLSSAALRPPSELSVDARTVWRRLAPSLVRDGVLTPADRETFADYCRACYWITATQRRLCAAQKRMPNTRETRALDAQLRGWLSLKGRLATALGLTARARARGGIHWQP